MLAQGASSDPHFDLTRRRIAHVPVELGSELVDTKERSGGAFEDEGESCRLIGQVTIDGIQLVSPACGGGFVVKMKNSMVRGIS